jgi:hypothetical protein
MSATWCASGETCRFIPTQVILGNPEILIFALVHLVTSIIIIVTHHGSITFVSQHSLNPVSLRIRMLQLTVISPLRVSSVAVYGRHGEAVKLCVDAISHSSSLLSTNTVSSCLMCAVNANELERLKKRFMKLDRCHSSPSPYPAASAALCPKYSHAVITCPLRI